MIESLIREFDRETRNTRRQLEKLPADKLDWRPHVKSFSARELASHLVDCVGWVHPIFTKDEFAIDPATFRPYVAASVADLLAVFDARTAEGQEALDRVSDEDLERPWRLTIAGRVRFERPKADVFRDFTLSHQIHHRGQLSVYLRLLDVPVPGCYGPSADERP